MDSQVLFIKNDNGTIDRVLALNASTILTTTRNLSQLSDVDTSGLGIGAQKVLTYNSTTTKWEPVLPTIANLGDVEFAGLSGSNVIKWNPANNKWINRDLGYAVMTIQGQLKDSVFNANTEFNILNPANYETGTFSITPFTNNSINIDTTTNFQVDGLVSGANYRVEWNFNYNILTSASSNGLFTFYIRNQSNNLVFLTTNQITTGMRTFVSSMSGVNATASGYRFTIQRNALSTGSFTGATPLNLNCVISVIEM